MDWYPLLNSLRIAAISAVVVFFAGIAAAYYIAKLPRLVKGILDVILTLPLVLPPTVVGYLLLRVLGPKRLIGAWVLETFGIRLVMTWWSAIFATVVVVFPLMYRTVRGAFEAFDETLGLSNTYIFWHIRMPYCRQGVLAGAVLAFARALGEYGATSMIAGYIPGKTATVSTTVYQLWQINNDALALKWVLVNVGISAVILLVVNMLEKKNLLAASSWRGWRRNTPLSSPADSSSVWRWPVFWAILLDEPFSALDSFLKWNLELELADLLAGFGGPILWVSHDLGECYRNCKTVCVMENGVSSPVTDMKTLVQHPATQGAARLAGCRNFLPTRRCGDGVRIDGWDITLPLKADAEQVTVAIPDSAISLGDGPYTARVFRVIQDLETSVVLLQPEHAPDAVMLRAAAADIGSATPGEAIAFRLQAEKCLCY